MCVVCLKQEKLFGWKHDGGLPQVNGTSSNFQQGAASPPGFNCPDLEARLQQEDNGKQIMEAQKIFPWV